MPFGVELRNNAGATFLGQYETTFMYWGYKDITHNQGASNSYIDLFGIPVAYTVQAYVYAKTEADEYPYLRAIHVILDSTTGFWRASVQSWNYSGSARVFVFAESAAFKLPKYGVAIYDNAGNVRFHSARPLLSLKLLGEVVYSAGKYRNNASFKPACVCNVGRVESSAAGSPGQFYVEYSRFIGFYNKEVGSYQHGVTIQTQGPRGGPQRYQPADRLNYAVIDASYYESLSSVGNYPQ
jgi:hypothetical protein